MKCPICGGTGKTYRASVDLYSRCDECHGTGTIMKTNEDWFDSLSTKEKAKFICNLMKGDDLYLGVMSVRDMIKDELNHGKDGSFVVYEWLEEKHDGNT